MAEILLSLTIIGVVAAVTLPALVGNINERTWNTQRKALFSRMSQAISMLPSLNGYGTLNETTDTAAETFVTEGLAKVLKINNICDSDHLTDCGIASTITDLTGRKLTNFVTSYNTLEGFNSEFKSVRGIKQNSKAAAFETQNGESILVYYNPYCLPNLGENYTHYSEPKMCANFIYDLNGTKGPNTFGKDIGSITVLYATSPVVVAPMPLASDIFGTWASNYVASEKCTQQDPQSRLPNLDELSAMFYNRIFSNITLPHYWSGTIFANGNSDQAWVVPFDTGNRYPQLRSNSGTRVRCIKR